jgi:hypothetical protein
MGGGVKTAKVLYGANTLFLKKKIFFKKEKFENFEKTILRPF